MTYNVSQMINEVRTNTGVSNIAPFDDTGITQFINYAYWHLLNILKFDTEDAIVTAVTVAGQNYVSVPASVENLNLVSIENPDSLEHSPLARTTPYDYEKNFINDNSAQDIPTKYFRLNDKIYLWPTPDDIYNLKIYYVATLTDLTTADIPKLPKNWFEILVAGATWRAFLKIRDFASAQYWRGIENDLLAPSKTAKEEEEKDTHEGGVNVIIREDYV